MHRSVIKKTPSDVTSRAAYALSSRPSALDLKRGVEAGYVRGVFGMGLGIRSILGAIRLFAHLLFLILNGPGAWARRYNLKKCFKKS